MNQKLFDIFKMINENSPNSEKHKFDCRQFLSHIGKIKEMVYDEVGKRNFSSAAVGFRVLNILEPKKEYESASAMLENSSQLKKAFMRMGIKENSRFFHDFRYNIRNEKTGNISTDSLSEN